MRLKKELHLTHFTYLLHSTLKTFEVIMSMFIRWLVFIPYHSWHSSRIHRDDDWLADRQSTMEMVVCVLLQSKAGGRQEGGDVVAASRAVRQGGEASRPPWGLVGTAAQAAAWQEVEDLIVDLIRASCDSLIFIPSLRHETCQLPKLSREMEKSSGDWLAASFCFQWYVSARVQGRSGRGRSLALPPSCLTL